MHEFETFAYLDVKKTGSSFISAFLTQFSREKEIRREKHLGMPEDYDRSKFYFISVRSPLDQYISLYSYGCGTNGKMFNKLNKKGFGNLYDGTWRGFHSWLRFILDAENAPLLGEGYGTSQTGFVAAHLGYQSFRVLQLALPGTERLLKACQTKEAIKETYKRSNIAGFVVRNETLRVDLIDLVRTNLSHRVTDINLAVQFIESEEPHNTSDRIDRYEANPQLGKRLQQLLEEREWLMYEEFGY